ncbi:MAG: DNA polymerase Y family protein [Gammaproteobacteria bacterium]|nr:DNA polymerase Y family protein [Gammaproteobacteria bacterium]MBT5722700.1 DNA polymerase Y family protein [Gammaproteobacteria bacterium]MBT6584870.1 DNA polymerase Y family protein [Gammaproteobacteria bacterium]
MSNQWICLHFPQLPVEVFSRHQVAKPVVVTIRQRVVAMNHHSQKIGIRIGSSMNTAYTISEDVVSFERKEDKELEKLTHLAQWAYQFTPNVSIKSPHSLLLDVAGCLKLFKGIDNLKKLIREGLDSLGFEVMMGVNGTPLAALLFAEAGLPEVPVRSKIAQSLASVPVHYLRIEENIKGTLHQMGISHCKQLFELPMDGLNRRFGVFFTDYLQRLTGEKPDPQKYIDSTPRFRSDITFLADVTNLESLAFPLKRLLSELQAFLIKRQLMTSQFTVKLSHRGHPPREFSILLANPDNDAQMFLMLSQLQLEKINDMPEVDNISVAARNFFEPETHSGDLFHGTRFKQKDGRMHSKAEEAKSVRLINMMTARLGPQACFGLSLANDHRPERAWKPVTLAAKDYWQGGAKDSNPRPLYLLPTPKALPIEAGNPCMSGKLELLQGPERIDFGWWDNDAIARDYYIAKHQTGSLYWIYQHLDNSRWYLHGIFS